MEIPAKPAKLPPLLSRQDRMTYLVTYSRADLKRFPDRQDFARLVVGLFNDSDAQGTVEYWACGREAHPNTSGFHYHLALKLTNVMRWNQIKAKLIEDHDIVVNFSGQHDMYPYAQRYAVKEDLDAVYSLNHPPLAALGSPKTKKAIAKRRSNAKAAREAREATASQPTTPSSSRPTTRSQTRHSKESNPPEAQAPKPKVQRVGKFEVSRFIAENDIEDVEHLWAAARARMDAGENDLARFLMDRQARPKEITSLFEGNSNLKNSLSPAERPNPRSRMEVLREVLRGSCVPGCEQHWFRSAIEILEHNRIDVLTYAKSMRVLFEKGRGKRRNIMLVGPKDSGKTFLMDPIRFIFKTFLNPADDKYTWQDAEHCEAMFFNDFRWSKSMIRWNDLLVLLEGHPVRFPVPKNQRAKDILFERDVPIFGTSRCRVTYGKNDDGGEETQHEKNGVGMENGMMRVRWVVYELPFSINNIVEMNPCPRCYANLVFYGDPTA